MVCDNNLEIQILILINLINNGSAQNQYYGCTLFHVFYNKKINLLLVMILGSKFDFSLVSS
jgi:hypothetical protein